MMYTARFVLLGLKGRAWDVWNDLGDVSYCFCPAFSEYHAGAGMKILGVLDETEATRSFVSSAQVVFIH